MNEKRGFAPLLIIGVFITMMIFLVSFLFSSKMRWILIGVAILIGGVYLLGKAISSPKGFTKGTNIAIFSFMFIGVAFILMAGVLQTTYGSTSLSISNVDITDDGKYIRIYGVANGAENLDIYWTPDMINNKLNSEDEIYKITKTVVGQITMNDPTREFYLTRQNDKPHEIIKTYSLSILKKCENNIPEIGGVNLGRASLTSSMCLYWTNLGTYSTFSGVKVDNTPVNINIAGSTGILNPSSGANVLTLNDGKTKIEWVGNLVNYVGLDTPSSYAALYQQSQFSRLISATSYSSVQTAKNSFGDCMGKRFSFGPDIITNIIFSMSNDATTKCVNDYNNKVMLAITGKSNEYINAVNAKSFEFTSNGAKVHLKAATVFPTFIITLDAAKVGIIELRGEPDITSCVSTKTILSGDTYSTDVTVKNIGNDGSFYGQLTCSGSSLASGTIGEQFFSAGETKTIPVQVSGANIVSGIQSNNCVIKIIDRKSQKSDTCNFNLNVQYVKNTVCEPNKITCADSETLKTCSNDGSTFTTSKCQYGCIVLDDGTGVCKENANSSIPSAQVECDKKSKSQPIMGWTWVSSSEEVGVGPLGIGRLVGWTKVNTSGQCKATFLPYLLLGGLGLIFIIAIVIILVKSKKSRYRP